MATKETIAGALALMRGAKKLLDASKWVNRAPHVACGEHCSVTPMTSSLLDNPIRVRADHFALAECIFMQEAQKISYVRLGNEGPNIPQWNDRRDRTREQVELAYDRTIARLENAVPIGE